MRIASLVLALSFAGCAAGTDDPEAIPSAYALTLPTSDAALVLGLVNHPGTDLAVLDESVGLDARAARGIVEYRDAEDLASPADDELFDDLAELDAVPYVGDVAFERLVAYARTHPVPAAESVEGVLFRGWESDAVVWGVANADAAELDSILDARAAQNLGASRPFATVTAMGPVAYVGTTALVRLRAEAPRWWSELRGGASLAGTFDGVAFDEATATVALDIANAATRDQLLANGVYAVGADAILGARPHATLAAVAATPGVGAATMQALRAYARSARWSAPTPTPTPGFVLDAAALGAITTRLTEGLWEDEAFVGDVVLPLAGSDALGHEIMRALESEIVRLAAPLAGTTHASEAAAYEAVAAASANVVKSRVRTEGWTYLRTLGLYPPTSFVLDAARAALLAEGLGDGIRESETFAADVWMLAGGDENLYDEIFAALGAEIARVASTLVGSRYESDDEASEAMMALANVIGRTRAGGWTYLESLGVARP